jgi:uncharacterized membrane protein YebE (DUF533 family)
MADAMEVLGALLKRGMTNSSTRRIEHSLSDKGIGGVGGVLEQELGVSPAKEPATVSAGSARAPNRPSSDVLGSLGELAKSLQAKGPQGKSLAAGGLGALLGALLGGGSKSAKGAVGGGALALLGSIALQALRAASQQRSPQELDPAAKLAAGLRQPESKHEEQQVQAAANLIVKAMINAAKADGRIDEDEFQNVVGELQEEGLSEAEREFLMAEVRKPINTEEIVRAVQNPQVAAQVYAASLLAIEVDTPAEKEYLQRLAQDLKLDPRVISQLHGTLGVA